MPRNPPRPPRPSRPQRTDLDLADEDDLALASPPSDLNLEDIDEPTVAADVDDDELRAGRTRAVCVLRSMTMSPSVSPIRSCSAKPSSATPGRPPSTIIGKADLDLGSDLDLSLDDKGGSDMNLAPRLRHSFRRAGDDLALEMEPAEPSGEFEGLPEVDIDLEAESSRILAPEEAAKVKGARRSRRRSGERPGARAHRQRSRAAAPRISTSAASRPVGIGPASPDSRRWSWTMTTIRCSAKAATSRSPARAAASTSSRRPTADSPLTKWRSTWPAPRRLVRRSTWATLAMQAVSGLDLS